MCVCVINVIFSDLMCERPTHLSSESFFKTRKKELMVRIIPPSMAKTKHNYSHIKNENYVGIVPLSDGCLSYAMCSFAVWTKHQLLF